jgi:hypothetical protein
MISTCVWYVSSNMNGATTESHYTCRTQTRGMPLDTEQFEARLVSHGVYVTSLTHGENALDLEYESVKAGQTDQIPHQEIGRVINVYRDLTDESIAIQALVTDLDGDSIGTWRVNAKWLRTLADGTLTEVEFSQQVLETIDHSDND